MPDAKAAVEDIEKIILNHDVRLSKMLNFLYGVGFAVSWSSILHNP